MMLSHGSNLFRLCNHTSTGQPDWFPFVFTAGETTRGGADHGK